MTAWWSGTTWWRWILNWLVQLFTLQSAKLTNVQHSETTRAVMVRFSLRLLPSNKALFRRIIFDSFALVCIREFMGDEIWQRQLRRRVQKWLGMPLLICNASVQAPFCRHLCCWSVSGQNNKFLSAAAQLIWENWQYWTTHLLNKRKNVFALQNDWNEHFQNNPLEHFLICILYWQQL